MLESVWYNEAHIIDQNSSSPKGCWWWTDNLLHIFNWVFRIDHNHQWEWHLFVTLHSLKCYSLDFFLLVTYLFNQGSLNFQTANSRDTGRFWQKNSNKEVINKFITFLAFKFCQLACLHRWPELNLLWMAVFFNLWCLISLQFAFENLKNINHFQHTFKRLCSKQSKKYLKF